MLWLTAIFMPATSITACSQSGGALPTKDGSLLVSLYRISTDGVAGFGSSAKHPVARGLMGPYFEEMFKGLREKTK